jgi:hypothetical protein
MPPGGFEPTFSAGELPQTDDLDRAATGTGNLTMYCIKFTASDYFQLTLVRETEMCLLLRRTSGICVHSALLCT